MWLWYLWPLHSVSVSNYSFLSSHKIKCIIITQSFLAHGKWAFRILIKWHTNLSRMSAAEQTGMPKAWWTFFICHLMYFCTQIKPQQRTPGLAEALSPTQANPRLSRSFYFCSALPERSATRGHSRRTLPRAVPKARGCDFYKCWQNTLGAGAGRCDPTSAPPLPSRPRRPWRPF